MNNAGINLHENYSNFANLYIFSLINVGDFGAIWLDVLSNNFQYLNNITRVFTQFFTHMYF